MAIEYKIYKSNINNGTKDKYYGRVTYNEMYDLPKLAAHMASHNTSFSRGQILAILTDIVKCIRELLIDSKKVRLDNLGIFHVSIRSEERRPLRNSSLRITSSDCTSAASA